MLLRRPSSAWIRRTLFQPRHAAANPCGIPSRRRRTVALWSLRKYEPAILAKIAFFHTPLVSPPTPGACLLLPSLFVHALHKKPKAKRGLPHKSRNKNGGEQPIGKGGSQNKSETVCQVAQTGDLHQNAYSLGKEA